MTNKWTCVAAALLLSVQHGASSAGSIPKEFVDAHNAYRMKVNSPRLEWSETLAAEAQQWATTLLEREAFTPRRDGPYGQNMFEITGGHATPPRVVEAWMSEEPYYNHASNTCSARCGHYTQVIWRATKFVGCGIARNARREVWVCDYDPPGNVIGQKPY